MEQCRLTGHDRAWRSCLSAGLKPPVEFWRRLPHDFIARANRADRPRPECDDQCDVSRLVSSASDRTGGLAGKIGEPLQ